MPERERDPALAIVDKKPPVCEKMCGSKRCKHHIKEDRCHGIPQGVCISKAEKLPADRQIANTILRGKEINKSWLNNHGARVAKSHLAMTISLLPQQP